MGVLAAIFESLVSFFASSYGTYSMVLAIATFGLYAYIDFLRKSGAILRAVTNFTNAVRHIDPSNFHAEYHELDESVGQRNQWFRSFWIEYSRNFHKPPDKPGQKLYSTADPRVYFNETSVVFPRLNVRWWNAVPGLLIAAGIFGTFVGLVSGISLAKDGLLSNDLENMLRALQQLLGGASTAFSTSIAGLIFSGFFSYSEKRRIQQIRGSLNKLCEILDDRIQVESFEALQYESFKQLKEQTEQLKHFNSELAASIATALDERLDKRLTPVLEKFFAVAEDLREYSVTTNQEIITNVVQEFRQTLVEASGKEMQAMGRTLEQLNSDLWNAAEILDGTRGKLEEALTNALVVVEETSDAAARSREMARDTAEVFKHAMDDFSTSLAQAQKVQDGFGSVIESISDITGQVAATSQGLESGAGALVSAADQIQETALGMTKQGEAVRQVWEEQRKRFEGLDERLGRVFIQFNDGLDAHARQVTTSVEEMDRLYSKSIGLLSGAIKELSETGENLHETVGDLNESVGDLNESLARLEKLNQGGQVGK